MESYTVWQGNDCIVSLASRLCPVFIAHRLTAFVVVVGPVGKLSGAERLSTCPQACGGPVEADHAAFRVHAVSCRPSPVVNAASHLIAQPCGARRLLLFPAIPLRPRRGFSLRCLTCSQRCESHPGTASTYSSNSPSCRSRAGPVSLPACTRGRLLAWRDGGSSPDDFLSPPKPQVPYRYLNNRHRRPFQPSPDQETAQHPPNDLPRDYSGHFLPTPAIRPNT